VTPQTLQDIDFFSDGEFSRVVQGFTRTPYVLPGFPLTVVLELSADINPITVDLSGCEIRFHRDGSTLRHALRLLSEPGRGPLLAATLFLPQAGVYKWDCRIRAAGRMLEAQGVQEVKNAGPDRWEQGPLVLPVEGGLYLGNVAAAARPEFLSNHGISVILNAAEERDLRPVYFGHEMTYRHVPFQDFSHNPLAPERIWDAVRWMHDQLREGRRMLVHCHAGIGRSSSLIVSYLYLFEWPDRDFDTIVDHVRQAATLARHYISPHKDLADSLAMLRREHRQELSDFLGRPVETKDDPIGRVRAVAFANDWRLGDTIAARTGESLSIRAAVEFEGSLPPRGVFAWTNIEHDQGEPLLLRRDAASGLYEGKLTPRRAGHFWVTLFATPYRNNHFAERLWAGGNVHLDVLK
jgi:hypothetical protein